MSDWYHWKDGKVVKVDTFSHDVFQPVEDRKVGYTELPNGGHVSTVFLGLDHGSGGGLPVLWETMAFGMDEHFDNTERYTSYDAALKGHHEMVAQACQYLLDNVQERTIPIEAGVLIRGQFKRSVLAFCAERNLECTIEEDKGLLESLYTVRLRSSLDDYAALVKYIQKCIDTVETS